MGEWVVAVDIGNSRTKFGLFQNRQLKSHNSIEGTDEAAVLSHAQHILDSTSVSFSGLVWKLAGVVPLRLKTLENFLVSLGQDVIVLASSACIMPMDFEQKNSVGVDRLLACIAAWKSVPLGHSCIVVDAGTALTINRVSPNGFFCGGSIQPGWMLMARSLRNGTSQLPMLDFTNLDPGWPGQDTSSAIRAGLCLAMRGSIREVVRIEKQQGIASRLYFTGGHGSWLHNSLQIEGVYFPHLVLEGICLVDVGNHEA